MMVFSGGMMIRGPGVSAPDEFSNLGESTSKASRGGIDHSWYRRLQGTYRRARCWSVYATEHYIRDQIADESVESYAKKYRYMRFMCQETLDHLAFLKEKVKDVEGFWASTLVSTAFPLIFCLHGTRCQKEEYGLKADVVILAQARSIGTSHQLQVGQGCFKVLAAYRAGPGSQGPKTILIEIRKSSSSQFCSL